MFKILKILFYQRQVIMFPLDFFEKKKILSRLRRKQAKKMIRRERWKEKVANAVVKKLQILDDGERRKESVERKNEWSQKIKSYQQNKIIAEQTARKTEEKTKFWTLIIKTKEKIDEISRQRKTHKKIESALRNEEMRIAKEIAKEFVY